MTATETMTAPEMAGVAEAAAMEDGGHQIVSFRLAQEEYGIDVLSVQEIILIGQITRVPNVPDYVCGLINLRGHVIPIVDLRMRFGLPVSELTGNARVIVLNVGSKTIGIVVDEVHEVQRIQSEQIEPIGSGMTGVGRQYVRGLIKFEGRIVILLDVCHLVDLDESPAPGASS